MRNKNKEVSVTKMLSKALIKGTLSYQNVNARFVLIANHAERRLREVRKKLTIAGIRVIEGQEVSRVGTVYKTWRVDRRQIKRAKEVLGV